MTAYVMAIKMATMRSSRPHTRSSLPIKGVFMQSIDRRLDIVRCKMRLAPVLGFLAALALVPMAAALADAPKAATPDGLCDREEIANTGCIGPKDCLHPDPANCHGFIQCVPQPDGSGKPQPMPCPEDLQWNDKTKECDWPNGSTCPSRSGGSSNGASKVAAAAAVPAPLKDACRNQKPGVYVDPKRCDCFYACDKDHAIHYECCKAGLLYQVKHHICAAPSEVQCGNRAPPAKK